MNSNIKNRIFGASAVIAVFFGAAACGTETVTEPATQPGFESRVYPPTSAPSPQAGDRKGHVSADAAERKAEAEQERQDRASTDRWARGSNEPRFGYPGRP